ncbi:ABC transporter ATP-binding protein [Flavicella sediminum]|uniref:ABC transporter ATP-binding protein n=1 Tax=Flavicella sediminum TaxID=2585141 RepID=UPI00111E5CC2|nr:ABC transporter ATP-binding protein [Flavicella sediminum]
MNTSNKHIVLKTKDLSIGYCSKSGVNSVAKEINIHLEKGKLVCLLGKNGIGKSTLLRTLSKTQHALGGTVYLNNQDLASIASSEMAKEMSLVLTDRIPDSQLSVFELVALGRQPYTNWLGKLSSEDHQKAKKAIAQVGIEAIAAKKYYELSDGQLQKVMIARALAQDTAIIILDEPTAHLDMHHKIEVFKLLQNLVKNTGKTIILSTHEVNLALKIADILWLMTPRNFLSGSLQEHIAQKNLEELFPSKQIKFDPVSEQFILQN